MRGHVDVLVTSDREGGAFFGYEFTHKVVDYFRLHRSRVNKKKSILNSNHVQRLSSETKDHREARLQLVSKDNLSRSNRSDPQCGTKDKPSKLEP